MCCLKRPKSFIRIIAALMHGKVFQFLRCIFVVAHKYVSHHSVTFLVYYCCSIFYLDFLVF